MNKPSFKTLFIIFCCFFTSILSLNAQQVITPETALKSYINNGDDTFTWELKDSFPMGDVTGYNLLLTSQKWHNITWRHQLTVLVPKENLHDQALLFITGGSNKEEQPNWSKTDKMWLPLAGIATKNKAIVILLKQAPNQPLFGKLTEDALISYTLHNFKKDGDYSWPLLFPMVKSAVRAMDAVQAFAKQTLKHDVSGFVVTGASKRGWTTWLSAAIDDNRVKAIAPMVIDMLNMPATLDYQLKSYGEYSIEIQDYVKLEIPQTANTPSGSAITKMVDPFSYREKLTVPKLIFIGTNDQYWTVDAIKHYYAQIPGKNMIHYVPNAGHDLGGGAQALEALSAFFGTTINNKSYPTPTWDVSSTKKGVKLSIKTAPTDLVDAIVWTATSTDKDFRDDKWTSKSLGITNQSTIKLKEGYVGSGYKAFYVDLKYKNPTGVGTYTVSTRVFLTDQKKVL